MTAYAVVINMCNLFFIHRKKYYNVIIWSLTINYNIFPFVYIVEAILLLVDWFLFVKELYFNNSLSE